MKIFQRAVSSISLRCALGIAIIIGSITNVAAQTSEGEVRTIDVRQVVSMQNQGALLLDVREPSEFEQGHVPGSVLMPLGELKGRLQEIRLYTLKPVAVICASGRRSAQAAEILSQSGFAKISNVQGGMNAWNAALLPIAKGVE